MLHGAKIQPRLKAQLNGNLGRHRQANNGRDASSGSSGSGSDGSKSFNGNLQFAHALHAATVPVVVNDANKRRNGRGPGGIDPHGLIVGNGRSHGHQKRAEEKKEPLTLDDRIVDHNHIAFHLDDQQSRAYPPSNAYHVNHFGALQAAITSSPIKSTLVFSSKAVHTTSSSPVKASSVPSNNRNAKQPRSYAASVGAAVGNGISSSPSRFPVLSPSKKR